jgi:hypothetical protein
MGSRRPTNIQIVLYFIIMAFIMGLASMFSPVTVGTIREIPRSPAWGDSVVLATIPTLLQLPSCTLDSQGTVHVVYRDAVAGHTDIFHVTITNGISSPPQSITISASLKESVVSGIDSSDSLQVAFLDNRSGMWQVYLFDAGDGEITQITDTSNYKEDISLSIGPQDERLLTWTEFDQGVPHIYFTLIDSQGIIQIPPTHVSGDGASIASTAHANDGGIGIMYLEKRGYDHIIYHEMNYEGEIVSSMDLGECIHLDPVKLGIFKGPQLVTGEQMTCLWSDFRTGSNNIFALHFTQEESLTGEPTQLTHNPTGVWSWMPHGTHHKGAIHLAYVNNAFGHRIFHAVLAESYQELGTITAQKERATAPWLCSDGEELHCVYLQFGEENKFHIIYRDTYPSDEKKPSFSDTVEESVVRYLYSLGFSFLFAFPLTFRDNALGIILFIAGFFIFRFFKLREICTRFTQSEYVIVLGGMGALLLLRGSFDYTFLAPITYEMSFITYGLGASAAASVIFTYLMGSRFDFEIRIVLACFLFLYLSTLFMLLPIIPHI